MFPSYPHKFGPYTVEGPVFPFRPGTVFRAHDYVTEQGAHHVALKILPASVQDPRQEQLVTTFFKNADALSALAHPQLPRVLDFGTSDGRPYLAMEWIDGPTLASQAGPAQPWEPKAALQLIRQLTSPLGELHRAGLIHRDLKPDNIRLVPGRGPVLVDLGAAHTRSPSVWSEEASQPGGLQLYLSPEQVHGAALSPASDVFSLGVILYQLLTGRMPFDAGTPAEVLHQIQHLSPMPPSSWNRNVPPVVDAFLWHVLAKEPAERVPFMESFREGLDLCLKQMDVLGAPATSAVSLADFTAQLERSLGGAPRRPEHPVHFTSEGGIAPEPSAVPSDLFGTVASVTRQPLPLPPSREPDWLRQRRQMQKQTTQIMRQLETEEQQRRRQQEQQARDRRKAELEQATPDQLRQWCQAHPTEGAIRKAYLSRRTDEQAALDKAEVGRAAKTRRARQGLFLGGLLGLTLGLLIGLASSGSGSWGWAGGAATGGLFLGCFGGFGGGPKGAASAGAFGAGVGAAGGGLCGGLPLLLVLLILSGGFALLLGLLGAWISGSTAAKDWAALGPLPASAYRLSLEQAKQTYVEG